MREDDALKRFTALDPAGGRALAENVPDEEWREMMERITATPRKRRPVWRRPTTRAGAFVVVTASLLAFASAIAGDRTILVDAADALRNPAAVEKELAREGITVEVFAVPVMDSLEGKWFHMYVTPGAAVDADAFGLLKSYVGEIDLRYDSVQERCPMGGCERSSALEIPGDVKGPLTLVVGRPAGPGESYWAKHMGWGNELAPSGGLYCLALEKRPPEEAAAILEGEGYRVEWVYDPPHSGENSEPSGGVDRPLPGTGITVAYSFEPGVVSLRTSPESEVERWRRSSGTPTAESGRPDFRDC